MYKHSQQMYRAARTASLPCINNVEERLRRRNSEAWRNSKQTRQSNRSDNAQINTSAVTTAFSVTDGAFRCYFQNAGKKNGDKKKKKNGGTFVSWAQTTVVHSWTEISECSGAHCYQKTACDQYIAPSACNQLMKLHTISQASAEWDER